LLAAGVVAGVGIAAGPAANSGPGEVVTCHFANVKEPQLPANPNASANGRCVAFGVVSGGGPASDKFTLLGNPPTAVNATNTFTGHGGSLTVKISHAPTVPVTFLAGPPPAAATAVAIGPFVVTKATGTFARFEGKHGVSGAYGDNVHRTLNVSLLLK
jgi:hypothetical protein